MSLWLEITIVLAIFGLPGLCHLYGWMKQNALTHTRDWYEDRVIDWIQKDLRPLPLASWEDSWHPAYDPDDLDNIERRIMSAFRVPSYSMGNYEKFPAGG